VDVGGIGVFYREAGPNGAPTILLLHGFRTAGHMFRDLIPQLAERFRLVAPDLLGFGQSDIPARSAFTYTFENLASVIDRFTEAIGLHRFAIYVFGYGAPVGFRLAVRRPDRIAAIISALRSILTPETTYWQYTHGVPDVPAISRDGYSLDMARPGADEIQLDLFGDYNSNVALYPTFQDYFRTHKPRFLAAWGKNDRFFLPRGAAAFRRDIPDAIVHFFDTGHFALETHAKEIAPVIRGLFAR
jgi:pimeloyl-ACP methyl ester carboxylesterase